MVQDFNERVETGLGNNRDDKLNEDSQMVQDFNERVETGLGNNRDDKLNEDSQMA